METTVILGLTRIGLGHRVWGFVIPIARLLLLS